MDINNPRMDVFKTLFQSFLHFINAFFKITRSSYQTFTSLKIEYITTIVQYEHKKCNSCNNHVCTKLTQHQLLSSLFIHI